MFKTIRRKFNSFTDFATRIHFLISIAGSVLSSGGFAYMTDFLLTTVTYTFTALGVFTTMMFIGCWIENKFKRKDKPEEGTALSLEAAATDYVSLQEAATILAETMKFTPDKLQWVAPFPDSYPLDDMFWGRDNPELVHKETLDEATTIPLIQLCLHMCVKNKTPIYGKLPSYKQFSKIPYEEIKYFDTEYKKLYSDIARESTSLIYNEVGVERKDLVESMGNTDFEALFKEMNER